MAIFWDPVCSHMAKNGIHIVLGMFVCPSTCYPATILNSTRYLCLFVRMSQPLCYETVRTIVETWQVNFGPHCQDVRKKKD